MDPIQPIGNQPPTIPRVAPAPRTRRIERDASRPDDPDGRRQRRRRAAPPDPDSPEAAADDEPGPHVDVTA